MLTLGKHPWNCLEVYLGIARIAIAPLSPSVNQALWGYFYNQANAHLNLSK